MILVLGGTGEARELADGLDRWGIDVITSLAGRVSNPRLPRGKVRMGGFGGPGGLAGWLREHSIRAVVDATHPFAERITQSAAQACASAGLPMLRLERPRFHQHRGDRWTRVEDLAQAAGLLPARGRRILLTTGRQGLGAFAGLDECWFLIRCVEAPAPPLPSRHQLLLDRGPYTVACELELIDAHQIDLLVTKDSGGAMTQAKLEAARRRLLPVIMVDRPSRPAVPTVATVPAALRWASRHAAAAAGGSCP